MKDAIESAIKKLVEKSEKCDKACDALQYSQAALNLAHTLHILKTVEKMY